MRYAAAATVAIGAGISATFAATRPVASAARPAPRISWIAGPALPTGRDHHMTFLTTTSDSTAYLWVAGGNDYHGVMSDVWRIHLSRGGEPIGEWSKQSPLPAALAGASVAVSDRAVVIAGGQDATMKKHDAVYVARIGADGGIGPWQAGPTLGWTAFHHSLVYHGGWVYATGGLADRVSVSTAARAPLSGDGVLGPWSPIPAMPRPRSHHASFVIAGRLCVAGGLDGNPAGDNTPLSDIQCAKLNGDGSTGPWEASGTLPRAVATHAVAHGADWIAVLGGVVDNRDVTAEVWRASVDPSGVFGVWERGPDLPEARSHVHQAPVWSNRIYSVGGSDKRVVTGALRIGILAP